MEPTLVCTALLWWFVTDISPYLVIVVFLQQVLRIRYIHYFDARFGERHLEF